ncbi:hypothetical protein [Nonomuraea sp. NEAU-A123]|uniref:hypothetical protein n=1 Tax=Nonomuraea sp. NEAU-A123 TaxID=2839649 RepID=UPI001BE45747|nr:hypothetical protein [Nonomuraea sp. NEAU-A123]MBT2234566.1 hypothetical protein [Nonomuraea sp. NEAU-A123]
MRTRLAAMNRTACTDNVRVTGYDVYRAPGTLLGRSATNSITLTGLTPATAYGLNASTACGFQAGRPNGQTTVPSGYTRAK